MKKYDVGLVAWWFNDNYGGVLTSFALNKLIEKLGYSVLMIDIPSITVDRKQKDLSTMSRNFARKHYETSSELETMEAHNDICNTFVTGSDQMWNYNQRQKNTKRFDYHLAFANDSKLKISYASSFGANADAPDDYNLIIKNLLHRLEAISVREDFAVKICKDKFDVEAKHVVDPVFTADRDLYFEIAKDSGLEVKDDYVFAYILDPTEEKKKAIRYLSEFLKIKCIVIGDPEPLCKDKKLELNDLDGFIENASLEEFVFYICHANFVITDSYHGTCLSMILRKNFISIANKKRGAERFESLMRSFNLRERMIYDALDVLKNNSLTNAINYSEFNELLNLKKEESINWFKQALSSHGRNIRLKDVTSVLPENKCTGCGACSAICARDAITMHPNSEGFYKPRIDRTKCNDCGICAKFCPSLHPKYENVKMPECKAIMAEDNIRYISSSGGMFTLVSKYILKNHGYICGAAFDAGFKVKHILINQDKDLGKIRGSKYMQSDAFSCFRDIKHLLNNDKVVLFTGLPCQVAGLKAYLKKDYPNLYTIDLFCHGISSSKVFDKYRQDVLKNKEIEKLFFKAKEPWGWHAGINAFFKDGSKYQVPCSKDPYFVAFLNSLSKNIVCGNCPFNKLPRQGDLSIGDFWGISKFNPKLNDNKGTSCILINNKKGLELVENITDDVKLNVDVPLSVAINGNYIINGSFKLNKNRNKFFYCLNKVNFTNLVESCLNNRTFEQIYIDLFDNLPRDEHELYLIAKYAVERASGRKLVTWIRSAKFEKILKDYFNTNVAFGVTLRKEAVSKFVKHISTIKNKNSDYFIISLDRAYDAEAYDLLKSYGYIEGKDFVFRKYKPEVHSDLNISESNYYDEYYNSIEGFNYKLRKIIFRGFNNHIFLGKNVKGLQNVVFDLTSNNIIYIKDNVKFTGDVYFEIKNYNNYSTIFIGNNSTFNVGAKFRIYKPGSIYIGDNFSSSSSLGIHSNQNGNIIIGKDCMFSFENELWAGDGHPIFDVKSNKLLNINSSTIDAKVNNNVVIGDHVWLGKQAFILGGSEIGSGCIVGARSVVKGKYHNNSVIVGNPAYSIKNNITWNRNRTDKIEQNEYCQLTSDSKFPISGLNVLVLGGNSHNGRLLVNELLKLGNNITLCNRQKHPDNFGIRVSRINLDILNDKLTASKLKGKKYDVVFDDIAYCSLSVNNILSNLQCKRYIQLSSVEVYAPDMHMELCENDFNPYTYKFNNCDLSAGYVEGKRQAETCLYQSFPNVSAVSVRIPYVSETDRIYYYCINTIRGIPMNIDDTSRCLSFVQDFEVGKFLPWIAAQDFQGPINFASRGFVTIQNIFDYIFARTKIKPIIDTANGVESPFHVYNEKSFSMNLNKITSLGWHVTELNSWFYSLLDKYIERALKASK